MSISVEKSPDYTLVKLRGRLDAVTATELQGQLLDAAENASGLILDLQELAYISSAGLRVLLLLARKLKAAQAPLVLCHLNPSVASVFDISGFSTIFTIVADIGTAAESFSK